MIALTAFGASAFGFIMLYLQTGFKKAVKNDSAIDYSLYQKELDKLRFNLEKTGRVDKDSIDKLQDEISDLKKKVEANLTTNAMTDEQRNTVIQNILANLKSDTAQTFLSEIQEKVSSLQIENAKVGEIHQLFAQINLRLNKEISSLGRRGNLNMKRGYRLSSV